MTKQSGTHASVYLYPVERSYDPDSELQQWRWHWFPCNVTSPPGCPWAGQQCAWKHRPKRVYATGSQCLWSWTQTGRETGNGVSVTARKQISAFSVCFPNFKQAKWKPLGLFKFFGKCFSAFCLVPKSPSGQAPFCQILPGYATSLRIFIWLIFLEPWIIVFKSILAQ